MLSSVPDLKLIETNKEDERSVVELIDPPELTVDQVRGSIHPKTRCFHPKTTVEYSLAVPFFVDEGAEEGHSSTQGRLKQANTCSCVCTKSALKRTTNRCIKV